MARRPPPKKQSLPVVWIVAGVVVVLAAVIAFIGTREADDSSDTSTAGLEQTAPVEVDGDALAPFDSTESGDQAVGEAAPELAGQSFDGTAVAVSHDGQPKVLLFVAHWCPHCQREVPVLKDHLADSPLPAGIDLVTIATSTSADRPNYPPSAWLESEGWTFPVLADDEAGSAGAAFGLTAFPFFVAVDGDGIVVARSSGELTPEAFDELVDAAMGTAS